MRLNDVRLSTKIGAMIGLAVLCLTCTCAASLVTSYHRMVADRVGKADAVVDMATALAASLEQQVQAGALTREAAMKRFADTVSAERYDGDNYLFAFHYDGTGVAYPVHPEFVGNRNGLALQDARGLRLIESVIRLAQDRGAGELTYYFPHAGQRDAVRKISAVRGFAPRQLAIASGIYMDDVDHELWFAAGRLAMVAVPLLLLLVAAGVMTYRSVVVGLAGLSGAMRGLAGGDLDLPVPGAERRDEVGQMAGAVEVFRRGMAEAQRLAAERRAEDAGKAARAERLEGLTSELEAQLGQLAGSLSGNATVLEATARGMSDTALNANRQTASVTVAAQQASANVQTVAAAAEQLSASIGEISRQVAQSSDIAGKATENARRTDRVVQALSDGAGKIGEVVGLITSIAGQTNLLALNATNRGGTGRRRRQGLRRGGERGEEPGQPDREGHRGDRRADQPDPARHRRGGGGDPRDRRGDRRDGPDFRLDRRRGAAAGQRHRGDRPQRPGGRHRDRGGHGHHRPGRPRRDRDRIGGGAGARGRRSGGRPGDAARAAVPPVHRRHARGLICGGRRSGK